MADRATPGLLTGPPGPGTRAETPSRSEVRADIQGLRAVAVAAVLGYHLWPGAVPGGYVGVDVFLVISGYLITGHLLREPPDTWRAVGRFWGRRVRRLLPASALVVVVTSAAAVLLLPVTQLRQTADEAIHSALYVQNWALADTATDYLAAEGAATAFRHYWSLAVEEQFYLVWPLLIGVAVVLGRRRRRPRGEGGERGGVAAGRALAVVAAVVGGVLAVSLAWSAHLTRIEPAAAYYVTPTRMWELALGGAVAVVGVAFGRRWTSRAVGGGSTSPAIGGGTTARAVGVGRAGPGPRGARVHRGPGGALALVGLGAVLVAVATFSGSTPFPGTAALLPTLGTALVIAAAPAPGTWVGQLLGARPAQVLGDVSYSTYLWHWPLVVFAPFVVGRRLAWYELVVVAAASVALAAATKRWVEDPVRRSPRFVRSPRATAALLVVCTASGVLAGLGVHAWATAAEARATERALQAADLRAQCFGAASALAGAACADAADHLWTPPITAAADKPAVYADGCWNERPYTSRRTCTYGPDDADVRIALVGNSHAGSWFTPLEAVAQERGWQVTTFVASVCYPVDAPLAFANPASATGCTAWNAWVRDQVAGGGFDLVVMSARTYQPLAHVPADEQGAVAQKAYARTLDAFTDAGLPVLVMRDTPGFPSSVPDCVATPRNDAADCDQPRESAVEPDPLAAAAADDDTGLVRVLDVSDVLCSAEVCHAVVGGAIVYFDHGHLTAQFSASLAPLVEPALDEALAAGAG